MSNPDVVAMQAVSIGEADDEIIALEARLRTAQLRADVAALDHLLADELLFTGPDGRLGTKAQDLEAHGSGAVRIREHAPEELRIRRVGTDAAVAALRTRLVVEVAGALVRGTYRYTRIWARERGHEWRVVGGHVSEVPGTNGDSSASATARLELVALVVRDYDPAIDFFVNVLRFELIEDTSSLTNDGRPKRWVVVRPVGATTGILLARADGDHQEHVVGNQFAGRVGFFLRVDDFDDAYSRMTARGVRFVSAPRVEAYGRLAVFLDLEGNRWDLLGPRG
jgi:catechol 2,3-dioxygenase-like lactoylglutathione lyase family enzyme/ketosteroid isomerase-like protein